mgnify:FL=1
MAMEKFHFTSETGVKITLPWPDKALKAGFYRKLRKQKLSEEDKVWEILEKLSDEETLEKIDELPLGEFRTMISELFDGSEVKTGE